MVLLPAWLRHCGTVPAGIEQVLTKKTGQEERTVEGMAELGEGDGLFIPFKRGRYLPRHCEPLRVYARSQDDQHSRPSSPCSGPGVTPPSPREPG